MSLKGLESYRSQNRPLFSARGSWKVSAKQLHHTTTRSWVYNNDKRIVPSGRKHFTLWRWRIKGRVGWEGVGRRGIFWLMSIRYMVHSNKWGENNKVHWETVATKKQFYEILMGYIYWQASVTSNSLKGLQGEGERESLCLTDNHLVQRYMHMTCTHRHRHRNTLIYALVKLWLDRRKDNPSHTSRGHWEQYLCVFWEYQRPENVCVVGYIWSLL